MKAIFIDLETTHTNSRDGAITEIAAIGTNNNHEVFTFESHVRPHPEAVIADEALAVQGITRRDLDTFPIHTVVFDQFITFLNVFIDRYDKLDKALFIAHNAHFDSKFIENWFKRNGNRFYGAYFHRPYICTYILSLYHLQDKWIDLPDHKLATLASYMQIHFPTTGMLHSAMYDVELCRGIYNYIRTGAR